MARWRTLKPEAPADKRLAGCTFPARLTFFYVISQSDDYGLLLAEPRQLLGLLFPHDLDVNEGRLLLWIRELVNAGRLRWRVTTDGARVLEVVNWQKHQKVKNPGLPTLRDRLTDPDTPVPDLALGEPPAGLRRLYGDSTASLPDSVAPLREEEQGKRNRYNPSGVAGGDAAAPNGDPTEPSRKTASGKPDRPVSWVEEAHTLYADAIGLVTHGRLGKALKPVVDVHGWPQVKRWFTAYCGTRPYQKRDGSFHGDRPGDQPEDAVKDTRFCSPEDFAGHLATWRERCSPMVPR